ncbi:hypothetical protein O3P69_019350 [Scylla paramamosain]|uniref:XK-related protein n=1 Tax=Scylla paramamosain TaxID=85552 RepID=A0AAW0SZI6_SCYPA
MAMSGGGVCPFSLTWRLVYHSALTAVLLVVAGAQGVLLDIYILAFDKKTSLNYFWLLPDFLMVFPFVAAMWGGYKRNKELKRHPSTPHTPQHATQHSTWRPVLERVFGTRAEPVYVWLVYTALMVAKICVIFLSEIPNTISTDAFLSPQLLKITISMTALVFGLLVEGQSAWDSATALREDVKAREAYIRALSHGTALETLDTVAFLSLLTQSESALVLPLSLERLILALACINLFLPAVALLKLSHSDYGRGRLNRIIPPVYKLIHLWLTNVSFMVIRIYLWAGLSASVSPFLVKNIYHIFAVLREVWSECQGAWGCKGGLHGLRVCLWRCCHPRRGYGNKGQSVALSDVRRSVDSGEATAGGERFEEIDLKQCDRA